jgi:hypothetical protein
MISIKTIRLRQAIDNVSLKRITRDLQQRLIPAFVFPVFPTRSSPAIGITHIVAANFCPPVRTPKGHESMLPQ